MAIKKKHAGGAPSKYKDKFCDDIIDFFSADPNREIEIACTNKNGSEYTRHEQRANKFPFFSAFARKIKVSMDTLTEWKKVHPEFSLAYKGCKSLQKEFLIENGLNGLYATGAYCFTAKNITDMRDKQEVEHSGGVDVKATQDVKILPTPELRTLIGEILNK